MTCACMLFFFSSRRRHTRFDCDWSSDVCSSDLGVWKSSKDPNRTRTASLRGSWTLTKIRSSSGSRRPGTTRTKVPESAAHFSTSVTNEINLWRSLTFCDLATILRRLRALEYEPMLRTQHLIRLVSLSLLLAHAVSAQQDRSRSNSTASDTMRSGGEACLLLPFLGAFVSALAAAPPAILLLRSHLTPPDSLGGLRVRMLMVFVSAGGTGEVPHTAAYSGGLQL